VYIAARHDNCVQKPIEELKDDETEGQSVLPPEARFSDLVDLPSVRAAVEFTSEETEP